MFDRDVFLAKSEEGLAGAASEFANRRFNNAANRSYYACFQAAIAALLAAGIRARGALWGHDFVQVEFNGTLIARRKSYPAHLCDVLRQTDALRQIADHDEVEQVTETRAARTLYRATEFVEAVAGRQINR